MKYANNIAAIDELSASEGVFTTAQAQRLGISRNALSHACKVGRLERVAHGAYRLSGAPSSETDELAAIWKLTASTAFSWERQAKWDGVVVDADAGEPSQICHGGFDAGLAREQVDVPRGTRVDGSGKHALTALQDKGRIRVAEDAAQQPVEVEAGDGAVGV